MNISFREIAGDDDRVLFELFAAVRAEELGMSEWAPDARDQILRLQLDAQRRGYRDQFPGADERLILRDGDPIGWVIVNRSARELHGIDIALLAKDRRQGLGSAVIRALQREAAAEQKPMVITVQRRNVRAAALYERLGFQVIRETDLHTIMEWRGDPAAQST